MTDSHDTLAARRAHKKLVEQRIRYLQRSGRTLERGERVELEILRSIVHSDGSREEFVLEKAPARGAWASWSRALFAAMRIIQVAFHGMGYRPTAPSAERLESFASILGFALPRGVREDSFRPLVQELLEDLNDAILRVHGHGSPTWAWVRICIYSKVAGYWVWLLACSLSPVDRVLDGAERRVAAIRRKWRDLE